MASAVSRSASEARLVVGHEIGGDWAANPDCPCDWCRTSRVVADRIRARLVEGRAPSYADLPRLVGEITGTSLPPAPRAEYERIDSGVPLRLAPVFHFFWMATRVIGIRDRLRCPRCESVGTWKPHGGILDFAIGSDGSRGGPRSGVRRWLCKWCGLYYGPEGILQARIVDVGDQRAWSIDAAREGFRPSDAFENVVGSIDPWKG